jgi:hypothetical protein
MGIVVGATTLWVLFAAWLFLPYVKAHPALVRTVAVLAWLELATLMTRGMSVSTHAASEEIPLFALVVLVAGAAHGLGIGRRTPG